MKPLVGYILLVAILASTTSCWNWNIARQGELDPPDRPRVDPENDRFTPEWMNAPDIGSESLEDRDIHRTTTEGSAEIYIRLGLAERILLSDRTSVRIDFPVGSAGHPVGLAELAALAVSDAPDHVRNRPSLRRMITRLGGDLSVEVGSNWTRFTVNVPTSNWQSALSEITERTRRQPVGPIQFQRLQDQLTRTYLEEWHADPALGYAVQWLRHGDRTRTEIVAEIEDRYPGETMLFRRQFYRHEGAVVGVWMPEAEDGDAIAAGVKQALGVWPQTTTVPMRRAATAQPNAPTGVRWIEAPGRSRVAILIPAAAATPEWLVTLECFTMDGLGGRLGEAIEDKLEREFVMQVREIGHDDNRHLVLLATVDPEIVPILWQTATSAWQSLSRIPPNREELARARSRVWLRLARRQDRADEWLASAARSREGGPVQDLHRLAAMTNVRSITTKWARTRLAMVVHGGKPPAAFADDVTTIKLTNPDVGQQSVVVDTDRKTAARYLKLAVQAIGTRRTFRGFLGYEIRESWHNDDGIEVRTITSCLLPDELHRVLNVLGTRIEVLVDGVTGEEKIGQNVRKLTASEADEIRVEVNRHPLAILAAWSQGKLEFRLLGMRRHSGRDVALLERIDPSRPRLRITIERRSGLIRTVETIQRRPDIGAVRIRESYSDYRQMGGIRVPTHRVTRIGNATKGTESVVTLFRARY